MNKSNIRNMFKKYVEDYCLLVNLWYFISVDICEQNI